MVVRDPDDAAVEELCDDLVENEVACVELDACDHMELADAALEDDAEDAELLVDFVLYTLAPLLIVAPPAAELVERGE